MRAGSSQLPWAGQRSPQPQSRVRSLQTLALEQLASRPEMIDDLRCTDEHQAIELLRRILGAGRLDYRLACVFRDSGHRSISEAMSGLDLLGSMPTHNTLSRNAWLGR